MSKLKQYEFSISGIAPHSLFLLNVLFSSFYQPGKKTSEKFFFNDEYYTVGISVKDFLKNTERDFKRFAETGDVEDYFKLFGLSLDIFDKSKGNWTTSNSTSTATAYKSVNEKWRKYSQYLSDFDSGILILKVKKGDYLDSLMPELIGHYNTNKKREGIFSTNEGLKNEITNVCQSLRGSRGQVIFNAPITDFIVREIYNKHPIVFMSLKVNRASLSFPDFIVNKVREMEQETSLSGGVVSCDDELTDVLSLIALDGEAYKVSIANLFNVVGYRNNLFRETSNSVSSIVMVNELRRSNWNSKDCITQVKDWDWDIGHENKIIRNDGVDVYLKNKPTPEDLQKLKIAASNYLLNSFSVFLNRVEPKNKEPVSEVQVSKTSHLFGGIVKSISNIFSSPEFRRKQEKEEMREHFLNTVADMMNPYKSIERYDKGEYKEHNIEIRKTISQWSRFLFTDDVSELSPLDKRHLLEPAMEDMRSQKWKMNRNEQDSIFSSEFVKMLKKKDSPTVNPEILEWFFDGVPTTPEMATFPDNIKIIFLKKHLSNNTVSFNELFMGATMLSAWKMYDNSAAVGLVESLDEKSKNTVNFIFSVLQERKKFLSDEEFAQAKRSLGFITQPENITKVNMTGLSLAKALDLESLPLRGEKTSIERVLLSAPNVLQYAINRYIGKPVKAVGSLVGVFSYAVVDDVFKNEGYSYSNFEKSVNGLKKEYLFEVKNNVVLNLGEDAEKAKEVKVALNETFNFIVYDLFKTANSPSKNIEDRALNFLTAAITQHQIDKNLKRALSNVVPTSIDVDDFMAPSSDFKL